MTYRSKAPLRIGLAGGGTDVSPYSDLYGGAILNATVSLFAYANIEITDGQEVHFESIDYKSKEIIRSESPVEYNGVLDLHKGVYNRIRNTYPGMPSGFKLSTFVDAPAGSGLGTSSTLVVAIVVFCRNAQTTAW
jgi:D-glycero-alpha-D-manno-heptose-7-phosphate kinase